MKYTVFFVGDAEADLHDIYEYVKESGYPFSAKQLLSKIEKACSSLAEFPERGHIPPELERVGVFDYREIHIKIYRILYQIIGSEVYIHAILDGRRDLQEILQERLFRET